MRRLRRLPRTSKTQAFSISPSTLTCFMLSRVAVVSSSSRSPVLTSKSRMSISLRPCAVAPKACACSSTKRHSAWLSDRSKSMVEEGRLKPLMTAAKGFALT